MIQRMPDDTPETDARWASVLARDRTADGRFWYSVGTTGIFCRPSCPSRKAHRENVSFHDTVDSAVAAGFRPCMRCNPTGPSIDSDNAAIVERVCRLIEQSVEVPLLSALAASVGRSESHLHRLFKTATGLTPRDYARARRADRLRAGLALGGTDGAASACTPSVTSAMYDAGFGSSGSFYAQATDLLGMTPSRYRAGGIDEVMRFAVGQSSLGAILVASSEKGVAAILLGGDPEQLVRDLQDRFPKARLIGADAGYEALVARVVGFVEAPGHGLDLPLDVRGTAFQQRVWAALQRIPVGQTVSYATLATQIGCPSGARAVAGACAANPIAVAIPCHRVVRNDGALSGYAWGVARKRALLDREAAHV